MRPMAVAEAQLANVLVDTRTDRSIGPLCVPIPRQRTDIRIEVVGIVLVSNRSNDEKLA